MLIPKSTQDMFHRGLVKSSFSRLALAKPMNAGRKKVESRRSHGAAARDRHAKTLLVSHSHVAIHRLLVMG